MPEHTEAPPDSLGALLREKLSSLPPENTNLSSSKLDMTAWYEQHIALLHQFLHRTLNAIAKTPAKRNTKLVQLLGVAHTDLQKHTSLVAVNAIPTVLSRDGQYQIPYEKLAEARAKVQVLSTELEETRTELAALKVEGWRPAFDAMSPRQEELAQQLCMEIAGRRGEPGSPPDPVRLLEMAQALYEAERDTFCTRSAGGVE